MGVSQERQDWISHSQAKSSCFTFGILFVVFFIASISAVATEGFKDCAIVYADDTLDSLQISCESHVGLEVFFIASTCLFFILCAATGILVALKRSEVEEGYLPQYVEKLPPSPTEQHSSRHQGTSPYYFSIESSTGGSSEFEGREQSERTKEIVIF